MAGVSAAACHAGGETPEAGAALLRVSLGDGAQMPDQLHVFVYDDTGALWNDVRMPAEGALVPQSATELGTILIQPGVTVGDLRIDLRGLLAGVLVDEATLAIAPSARAGGTFSVTLAAALPADSDGDGVPNPIDDCPSVPDPAQTGCHADGGSPDAAHRDADTDGPATTARADAAPSKDAAHADAAPSKDAARDVPPPDKAKGAACGSAAECVTGFCKDGVCCNTACTDPCNSCVTGKCTEVKSAEDAPECIAPLTCNKKGQCVSAADGG
jgi:hypothetical protein